MMSQQRVRSHDNSERETVKWNKSNRFAEFVHKLNIFIYHFQPPVSIVPYNDTLQCLNSLPLVCKRMQMHFIYVSGSARTFPKNELAPHVNSVSKLRQKHVIMCHDNDLNVFLSERACNS